jgi:hexosaminidase
MLWVAILAATTAPSAATFDVWPAVTSADFKSNATTIIAPGFSFTMDNVPPIMEDAFARYEALLQSKQSKEAGALRVPRVSTLEVIVPQATGIPQMHFKTNETYSLTFDGTNPKLHAGTVFGALRGLETFFQLAYHSKVKDTFQVPSSGSIYDTPRFPYRGLMMDYSRHFYPVDFIKHTMDAMVMSKLNVLHMHITDDQSFPIESAAYPKLAGAGSYGKGYTYTAADVSSLVAYATQRAILLVPEFDMPAHSSSWGAGYPEAMVQGAGCSKELFEHGDTLNPTVNVTYEILDGFLGEMAGLFPQEFIHLGGDEVPTTCWLQNTSVTAWMKEHGMSTPEELESYFVNRVAKGKKLVASGRTLMYWEEIFTNVGGADLPSDSIIQAWKSNVMPGVLEAGHQVTNSYKWYLNHGCNNYGDGNWGEFYTNDPLKFVPKATAAQQKLVMGGETTMWGECVDAINFDGVVWPRAAAAAEQLWSPQSATKAVTTDTSIRLSKHRCMMLERGVAAAPINDFEHPRILNQGCQ